MCLERIKTFSDAETIAHGLPEGATLELFHGPKGGFCASAQQWSEFNPVSTNGYGKTPKAAIAAARKSFYRQ